MQALITAIGLMPISAAFSLEARTTAAAPSLRPDAFPAVTVPSLKIVRSFASFSALVVRFGYSSVSNIIGSPFFLRYYNRDNFIFKTSAVNGCNSILLAGKCEIILILP